MVMVACAYRYNPFGQSRLREIFIKQDNLIHGRTIDPPLLSKPYLPLISKLCVPLFSLQLPGRADQGGVQRPGVKQVPACRDACIHLRAQGHGMGGCVL
eukprot:scaffold11336_cov17-Tisochrysis_lutea.AAC.2